MAVPLSAVSDYFYQSVRSQKISRWIPINMRFNQGSSRTIFWNYVNSCVHSFKNIQKHNFVKDAIGVKNSHVIVIIQNQLRARIILSFFGLSSIAIARGGRIYWESADMSLRGKTTACARCAARCTDHRTGGPTGGYTTGCTAGCLTCV